MWVVLCFCPLRVHACLEAFITFTVTMSVFLIDCRRAFSKDSRLTIAKKVLRETAILARSMSTNKWRYIGIAVIVRNTFEIVLPFQDTEYLSILTLNKAFDHLSNIIESDVSENENYLDYGVDQSKGKAVISCTLVNFIKQFKKLKIKNPTKLLVTVLTVNHPLAIKNDLNEFTRLHRNAPNIKIEVINLNFGIEPVESSSIGSEFRYVSLTCRGLTASVEAVYKESLKQQSELKISFPCNGVFIRAKIESIIADLRFANFTSDLNLNEISIISTASLSTIGEMQVKSIGKSLLVTCSRQNSKNFYLWKSLCSLVRNDEKVLIANSLSDPLFLFVLTPCDDFRMILQLLAHDLLQVPVQPFQRSTNSTSGFLSAVRKIPVVSEYQLGFNIRLVAYLLTRWNDLTNTVVTKRASSQLPNKTKNNASCHTTIPKSSLIHPALGMY